MNFSQARVWLVPAGAVFAAAALVAGCGNNYRPVVTPVNPSGPPAQPQSYAVVVTAPLNSIPLTINSSSCIPNAGIATVIDYAGDSVLAQACIGPGPAAFTLDSTGSSGYTIDSDHTITNFPVSISLQSKNVTYTTLPSTAAPLNLFSPSSGLWAADLCATTPPSSVCDSATDVFTGSPQTFLLSIPLPPTPVMVVGNGQGAKRYFAVSQNIATPTGVECNSSPTTQPLGEVTGIETSYATDAPIPVGMCPVYAVQSSDAARLFVLNRGSDTVTVINAQNNTLDTCVCPSTGCVNQDGQKYFCHPTLPVSPAPGLTHAGPVYAEYNAARNLLIVANYDGNSISVIDVSLDQFGNDSSTFGTTYTIPVGANPASVTVLLDGSRAYTANQGDCTPNCTASPNGTVTIANLNSYTVEKTLPVTGYPRTVVSTQNSTYGKVYVASPNSNFLTILRTDQDIVDTTILLEGDIVDVRVTTQNGSSGNNNVMSRIPGYGQPCNLPGTTPTASLAACQKQP